jgi:hypothetical protein
MFRIAALLALSSAAVFAQTTPIPVDSLVSGAEVRIWTAEPKLKGLRLAYLGRTDTSLMFAEHRGSFQLNGFRDEIPARRIDRLEVYRGLRFDGHRIGHGILKGAGIGLLSGVVTGLAAGLAVPDEGGGHGGYALLGAMVFGTYGTLAGGAIGGLVGMRGTSQWAPVILRR